jgi:glycosyltransferase involved in cell wall biosynthesis
VYRWAFSGATVIHLSQRLARDVARVVDPDRLAFVPNGLPEAPSAPEPEVHDGPPRILFLSNMLRAKGPLVLVKALGTLAARGIELTATLAGASVDDAFTSEVITEIERLGLADRVRYVGAVYGAAKHALFRTHDVFVFPTLADAFPLVVLEAMQAGLPVVSSDEGAIPDMVLDGETGFVVPPGDVTAVADRLARLLRDGALRRRLGERGRARYREHFTEARFEQALADVLERSFPPAQRPGESPPQQASRRARAFLRRGRSGPPMQRR